MKRISLLSMIAMLAIGLHAQDTIFYHGYEPDVDPAPYIWSSGGATWTPSTVTDDAANAHTGSGYFKAVVDGNSPNVWDNQTVFQEIPVEDSSSYRLSLWVRHENSANDTARINITCGDYSYADIQARYETRTSNQWQRYHLMVYIADAGALNERPDTIRFPIHFPVSGTYYVDDVAIIKSTIAGIRYNKNRVAVDFGYAIDPVLKVSDPSTFTVTANGETVAVDSATMTIVQNDDTTYIEPYVYLNLAGEIADDADVKVSYNGEAELVYAAYSPITEGFKADQFAGEVAEHDPALDPVSGGGQTAVEDVNQAKLHVFPNPVRNHLHLTSDKGISAVTMLDITGKVIMYNKYNAKATAAVKMDVSSLNSGLYVLQVEDAKGQQSITKFIK